MTRRFLTVALSVLLALLGTAAVLLYVRSADTRATAGRAGRTVVVADKPIPAGTAGRSLRAGGYVHTETMPAGTVPADALRQVTDDLSGLVVTAAVQRGQLLLRGMFGTPADTGGGLVVPDGKMAITAAVKGNVFGPGSVRPGSEVAIFYTYTPVDDRDRNVVSGSGLEKGPTVNSVTRLLMTNVEVLAVGTPGRDAAAAVDAAAGTATVTFAVSQVDAERLAHAVALGGDLNIGALGDSSGVNPDAGVDNRSLFG